MMHPKTTKEMVLDVFEEIVKATQVLDNIREDMTDTDMDVGDDADDVVQLQKARKSFWERAQSMKKGTFKIFTASGLVKLRNKQHAASFAKRLVITDEIYVIALVTSTPFVTFACVSDCLSVYLSVVLSVCFSDCTCI
jgi:hypothetical protein